MPIINTPISNVDISGEHVGRATLKNLPPMPPAVRSVIDQMRLMFLFINRLIAVLLTEINSNSPASNVQEKVSIVTLDAIVSMIIALLIAVRPTVIKLAP